MILQAFRALCAIYRRMLSNLSLEMAPLLQQCHFCLSDSYTKSQRQRQQKREISSILSHRVFHIFFSGINTRVILPIMYQNFLFRTVEYIDVQTLMNRNVSAGKPCRIIFPGYPAEIVCLIP